MRSHFAPAVRTEPGVLQAEIQQVGNDPIMTGLLQTVSGLLAVLDENRQVLAVNDPFLELLGIDDPQGILGLRPGEALGCPHASEEAGGCGTSRYCSSCGAAIAIVTSLAQNEPVERLCALTAQGENLTGDLVLKVRAHPLQVRDLRLVLLFVQDITEQEQRYALERTFFHDISNLMAGLVGATELLPDDGSEVNKVIKRSVNALKNEIFVQKILLSPEGEELRPMLREVPIGSILEGIQDIFAGHPIARRRGMDLQLPAAVFYLKTDESLVLRVLANMVTNAFEMTDEGESIKVWVEHGPARTTFRVWNRAWIPPETERRVFQRNFSTKEGQGRGLGTYSMKLIGEKVLKGKVSFRTSRTDGTIFQLSLPR